MYGRLNQPLAARDIKLFVVYAEDDELFPVTPANPRLTGKNVVVVPGTTHDLQLYPAEITQATMQLFAAAA